MSRRMTRCLTWGEMRTRGEPLVDERGRRVGMIDFAEYVTLCGKTDENPKEAHLVTPGVRRPAGVCPLCWAVNRKSYLLWEGGEER